MKSLRARIQTNKRLFILYTILRIFVLVILVRSIFIRNFSAAAICLITLILFLVPSFLEGVLLVDIPPLFQGIIFCFIFAAEILGELGHYYTKIPIWDTMLHTLNGFLFAAVGFVTVDLLNRNSKNVKLTPLYLTMVAFCFSMTIGVLWEFLECGADLFLGQDMQKDFIIQDFQSTKLDPTNSQQNFPVVGAVKTEIYTASGDVYVVDGGFLDIGIRDTMKDLLVNLIGAIVFCTFGYIYLTTDSKGKVSEAVVQGLSIQPVDDPDGKKKEDSVHENK